MRVLFYGVLSGFLALSMGCALSSYQVTDEELRPVVARYEGAEMCCAWQMRTVETKAFGSARGLQPDPMGEIPLGTRVRVGKVISQPKGKWERQFWFTVELEGYDERRYIIPVNKDLEKLLQPCEGDLGLLGAGNALSREGKLDEAAGAYRQLRGGEKRYQVAAAYALGNIFLAQGKFEDAVKEFERAVGMNPLHADSHGALAALYAELGLQEKAMEEHRAAVAAYVGLAQEYLRLGQAGDAERASERAISSDREGASEPYVTLGHAYLQQGRRDEAIGAFDKGLELSPGSPHARLGLAMAYEHNEQGVHYGPGMDVDRALEEYTRLLEQTPLFPDAHHNLGRLYLNLERFADALAALGRTVELNPADAWAHHELAVAAFELKQYLMAWREARVAEQFIKGENPLVARLSEVSQEPAEARLFAEMYRHYVLGLRAVHGNEGEQAVEEFTRAISVGPPFGPVHNALGVEYAKQGNLKMAQAEFEKALSIDPHQAEAQTNLALLYHNAGRTDEALALLERAASVDPAIARTHKYLSMIYQARGRTGDAEREEAIYLRLTGRQGGHQELERDLRNELPGGN